MVYSNREAERMEREISIDQIKGIHIGQVENAEAATGCTVFICEEGMAAGLDVRGGGPASRESRTHSFSRGGIGISFQKE